VDSLVHAERRLAGLLRSNSGYARAQENRRTVSHAAEVML
jgi:hypothetical protein